MSSPPTILCDIGNVLVSFDFRIAAAAFAERCAYPAEQIFTQLEDLKVPFEDGSIEEDAFVAGAIDRLSFAGTPAEFSAIWCAIFSANEPMRRSLLPLQGRLPLHLLSNTSGLHLEYLRRSFEAFDLFDDGVYSFSAKASKPSPAIFQTAIRQLGLDPSETLFIDDLEPNIETARKLGFNVHHYRMDQHASFQSALDDWLDRKGVIS